MLDKGAIIKQIYNNNVALVCLDGYEMIITGRGITFGKHIGSSIDRFSIEKSFILKEIISLESTSNHNKNILSKDLTTNKDVLSPQINLLLNIIKEYVQEKNHKEVNHTEELFIVESLQYIIGVLQ